MTKNYAIGDKLLSTSQVIVQIIEQNVEFGVYITADKDIRYEFYHESGKIPTWAEPILKQFSHVATLGLQVFPTGTRDHSRVELALALRTALAAKNVRGCQELQALEVRYCSRYLRTAALWYVAGSVIANLIWLVLAVTTADTVSEWPPYVVAISCGGTGALLSVLQKLWEKEPVDSSPIYYFALEGAVRVLLGMICGAIAITLIKGNLVAGVAAGNIYAVASLCVAAGFVERFVPGILIRLTNKK